MEKILRNRRSMALLGYVSFVAWAVIYIFYNVQQYRELLEVALQAPKGYQEDYLEAADLYVAHAKTLGLAIAVATLLFGLYLWTIAVRLKNLRQLRSRGMNLQEPQNYEVLSWRNWIPLCALFISSHLGIDTFGENTTRWLVRCILPVGAVIAFCWLIEPKILGIKKTPKLRLTREEAARQKQARAKRRKTIVMWLILPFVCLITLIILAVLGKWKAAGITLVSIIAVVALIALIKYIKDVLTKGGFTGDDTVGPNPVDVPDLNGHENEEEEDLSVGFGDGEDGDDSEDSDDGDDSEEEDDDGEEEDDESDGNEEGDDEDPEPEPEEGEDETGEDEERE